MVLVAAGTRVSPVHFKDNKQKDKEERDREKLSTGPESQMSFLFSSHWPGLACVLVQLARACLWAMISQKMRLRSPGKCHIYPASQVPR